MSFQAVDPDYKSRVGGSFARQAFMAAIGAELTRIEPGATTIRLPWRRDLTQQHGFFHGGIVGTLADNAGGYAAFTLLPADHSILTVEFKVNLLSPARGEALESDSRVMRAGRTLLVCLSEVFAVRDGGRHLCATGLVTLMGLAGRADAPQPLSSAPPAA